MFFLPTSILATWLLGLLSFAILGGGAYLLHGWYDRAWVLDRVEIRDVMVEHWAFRPDWGFNAQTAMLVAGAALLGWALLGGLLVRLALAIGSKGGVGGGSKQPAVVLFDFSAGTCGRSR
jgi:hypothetical protein